MPRQIIHGPPPPRARRRGPTTLVRRVVAALTVAVLPLGVTTALGTPAAAQAPVGQGFNLNVNDLRFILDQIKISDQHAATATPENPCSTLLGTGPNQIPNNGTNGDTLPFGLRTVDGSCNNLVPDQERFGAADTLFPRKVPAAFGPTEPAPPGAPPAAPTQSYSATAGNVYDSQPRVVSNLIVDQTGANPAAVAAFEETAEAGAQPHQPTGTLPIPNVATDVGLSAPYNSMFTLFGQFFDHGLDLVGKGGSGTVFMPLKADDPLVTSGRVPPQQAFLVLTRATNQPGPDGVRGTADDVHEHSNSTTSQVDQNQTYTSHPSHQVFLRDHVLNAAGDPVPTGLLLTGPQDGMGDWNGVKQQARTELGIALADTDVLNVPLLATDPYGKFVPGPNGFPQLVTPTGLVEGDPAANGGQGVSVPAATVRTGHAFLDDIAHHAAPVNSRGQVLAPDADPGLTDDGNATTYDDEMLGAHFVAGDGRVNENIGLTAVHSVFHAEHNRLNQHIKDVLLGANDPAFLAEWQSAAGADGWNGERIFQAARFVTEMEYQHLVFEEFARKVQPLVNLFGEGGTGYRTDLDPAIRAEFAHAVYRFGHSMLNEVVARTNADGTANDVDLIPAFLNPPEFLDGQYTPAQATGAIFRGMTRQVGNEIDEFVTEALRNNLVGLPLDLATINIARARETGTPSLNDLRRHGFEETANTALTPYTSWVDFGLNLKHQESLVNFVAAYGRHPSITAATDNTGRRAAAQVLVDPPVGTPQEQLDDGTAFLNSTGAYADANGRSVTGVDDVDLWMGGLAEKRTVFGGLLGSTFNYVFEEQMEDLQFGDRFYYLSRVAGQNLLTQLEGNSFAELVMRNSDVQGLPADTFSRPGFVINLAEVLDAGGNIVNDPTGGELIKMPNGTIRYVGTEHVVFNGLDQQPADSAPGDRIQASEGDDTLRGDGGADVLEGGDGVDNIIAGEGDDILTDLFGDDTLKGGDGDDALSSGQGFGGDLNQGGRGDDFVYGGNDMTETFAGEGDDLVFAGQGEDTVFGDEGNDWIEGGAGPFNLLQGDGGAPFQNDPTGGHDVLDGDGGEQDFDAEGGDDIMLMGAGIQRAEGTLGFDWTTHKGDPAAANSDMKITVLLPPTLEVLRDRFDRVEALSGWTRNDVLRGDDRIAGAGGENPEGAINPDEALTQEGIGRIAGLQSLLPPGVTSFNAGNILIGGPGSDTIEGRGGDDVIDGDRWTDVRIVGVTKAGAPVNANSMSELRTAVFAGQIDPGALEIAREIVAPTVPAADCAAAAPANCDVAEFTGPRAEYTITDAGNGRLVVAHTGGTQSDGVDTLTGTERLSFANATDPDGPREVVDAVVPPTSTPATGAATVDDPTPTEGQVLTAGTTGIADADGLPPTFTFQWQSGTATSPFVDIPGATAATFTPTQAEVDRQLQVVVSFTDGRGFPERVVSEPTARTGDLFLGAGTAEVFDGTSGADLARGNGGNDTLGGVAGDDLLEGGTGTDTVNAGSGNDTIEVRGNDGSFDTVAGQADADRLVAMADGTVMGIAGISGVEEFTANGFTGVTLRGSGAANNFNFGAVNIVGVAVDGGGGNDTLFTGPTSDTVLGGTGTDSLTTNGGDDTLDGGSANDAMNGGSGNDRFVVGAAFGNDTITGFDPTALDGLQDRIDVSALVTQATFGQRVTIAAGPTAGSTLITVRNAQNAVQGTIVLNNVAPTAVNATDFLVAP